MYNTNKMSIRPRQLERENSRKVKLALQPPKLICNTKRQAFGEVGNKIHTAQNVAKLKVLNKAPTAVVAKKLTTSEDTEVIIKKTASIKISTVEQRGNANDRKIEKSLATNKEDKDRELMKYAVPTLRIIKEPLSYSSERLVDINIDDSDDPLLVSEYMQDIYEYLLELESDHVIQRHHLDGHKSTPRMRSVLVNWMVEVHINFKLLLETLHLSVALVDRYLQLNKNVGRDTLQLVGTAAMWVAGKYEEIYIPDIEDFVYICDDAFSKRQLKNMEFDLLRKLDFNLGRPLSIHFLRRFNRIANVNADHHTLGKYLLELALLDYDVCHIKPSLQAAAACCLAIGILDGLTDPSLAWSKHLVYYSKYTYTGIKSTVANMACALNRAETSKYQCIRSKYSEAKHGKISLNPKLKGTLVKTLIAQSAIINKMK